MYRHPAESCLERLHDSDVKKVYRTETGTGGAPNVNDVIGGDISIEVAPNATSYTVSYDNGSSTDTYTIKGAVSGKGTQESTDPVNKTQLRYAYSAKGQLYYFIDCPAVKRISKNNLRTSIDPPPDKKPSQCVKDATQ